MRRYLCIAVALLVACVGTVCAVPWSRSLPNGTVPGFPVMAHNLVLVQGLDEFRLYAFGEADGFPRWNVSLPESLFPHVAASFARPPPPFRALHHSPHHRRSLGHIEYPSDHNSRPMLIFQGKQQMFAIDAVSGNVVWSLESLSSPVYLPTITPDGFSVVTSLWVNATAPRCLTMLDVGAKFIVAQHCEHAVFATTLTDGSPLPVVVTERTFFGCFEHPRNPSLSFVLEVQMNDTAFPPHVFDFYPNTVMMTETVQFALHHEDAFNQSHRPDDGKPIRVSFAVSAWDGANGRYIGPTKVVSVIAQAGFIEWRTTLSSAAGNPTRFMVRTKPRNHQIVASDGVSFVVALDSETGHPLWNVSVNQSTGVPPASLGPVSHITQTDFFVVATQPVQGSEATAAPSRKSLQQNLLMGATDSVTVIDVSRGSIVESFFAYDSICATPVAHHDVLFLPSGHEITVWNITKRGLITVYLTNAPVYGLVEDESESRLAFGTSHTVYSFPLL